MCSFATWTWFYSSAAIPICDGDKLWLNNVFYLSGWVQVYFITAVVFCFHIINQLWLISQQAKYFLYLRMRSTDKGIKRTEFYSFCTRHFMAEFTFPCDSCTRLLMTYHHPQSFNLYSQRTQNSRCLQLIFTAQQSKTRIWKWKLRVHTYDMAR